MGRPDSARFSLTHFYIIAYKLISLQPFFKNFRIFREFGIFSKIDLLMAAALLVISVLIAFSEKGKINTVLGVVVLLTGLGGIYRIMYYDGMNVRLAPLVTNLFTIIPYLIMILCAVAILTKKYKALVFVNGILVLFLISVNMLGVLFGARFMYILGIILSSLGFMFLPEEVLVPYNAYCLNRSKLILKISAWIAGIYVVCVVISWFL